MSRSNAMLTTVVGPIRYSQDEHARLVLLAADRPLAAYVRDAVNRFELRHRLPLSALAHLEALRQRSVEINRIARALNSGVLAATGDAGPALEQLAPILSHFQFPTHYKRPPRTSIRSIRTTVRFSPAAIESLRSKSDAAGTPLVTAIRIAALGYHLRPCLTPEDLLALIELTPLSNNLKQILVHLPAHPLVSAARRQVMSILRNLR